MAVRRLAEHQPDHFAFTTENRAWAEATIRKFPQGRQASAVIPLLWRAQEQEGWVTKPAVEGVAEMLRMPVIRVLEIATFYTMFHLEPVGRKAHVQVCGSDRGAPGGDQTDWPALVAALDEVGYGGPLNIESFTADNASIATAASIWRPLAPTQDDLARDGLAFLRSLG